MQTYDAIGVIEVKYFTTALEVMDAMGKVASVQLLSSEKYLGGRLVSLIVGGDLSSVSAAVEAARHICEAKPVNPLKMHVVIPKPHAEIMKFIIPKQVEETTVTLPVIPMKPLVIKENAVTKEVIQPQTKKRVKRKSKTKTLEE